MAAKFSRWAVIIIAGGMLAGIIGWRLYPAIDAHSQYGTQPPSEFDKLRAYNDVKTQLDMGPRTVGSPAHEQARTHRRCHALPHGGLLSGGQTDQLQALPGDE